MTSTVKSLRNYIFKIVKLVLNVVALILYRVGNQGALLGIGGTWNLNDEKNADAEIVASGVFVGFLIYTSVQLIADCLRPKGSKRQLTDVLMNFVGLFMWCAVGGAALHYWQGYLQDEQGNFWKVYTEKKAGLALGSITIINGIVYTVDTVMAIIDYYRENA